MTKAIQEGRAFVASVSKKLTCRACGRKINGKKLLAGEYDTITADEVWMVIGCIVLMIVLLIGGLFAWKRGWHIVAGILFFFGAFSVLGSILFVWEILLWLKESIKKL